MSMLAKENEKVMLLMVKVMEQGEEPKKNGKEERRKGFCNFSPLAVLIDGLFLISKQITLDAMKTIFYRKRQGWT